MFAAVSSEVEQVKAGKLRLIAVTGDKRHAGFPDAPAIGESVPGYSMGSYFGVVGPGGMSKALGGRISQDIARALHSPELKRQLDARQLVPVGSTPEEFDRLVRKEMQEMAKLVEAAGITLD
jgi:tripartite-type tricarboxylate transporter receptor subunit TctC